MIKDDVKLGKGAIVFQPDLVNLYGCEIGEETKIGAFVEIRKGVVIGKRCKIQAFAFIPEGVTVEDGVFIGPHVCFTNDLFPRAVNDDGSLQAATDWETTPTLDPGVGVDETTSLPILPGSHAIAEADCWQTQPGGAVLGGNPYRVPAIGRLRSGPLEMVRAPVRFGQALIFTPYLIHAFNKSDTKTRMALEMRFQIVR